MILPVEKQVVCFELAKEMKELGYVQEGLWWWLYITGCVGCPNWTYKPSLDRKEQHRNIDKDIVAPTVAELELVLPDGYQVMHMNYDKGMFLNNHGFVGCKVEFLDDYMKVSVLEGKEILDSVFANALAKMWIYLKKGGLL